MYAKEIGIHVKLRGCCMRRLSNNDTKLLLYPATALVLDIYLSLLLQKFKMIHAYSYRTLVSENSSRHIFFS